jgi:hypothetical protein
MDLDTYEELTGTNVPDAKRAKVAATIDRARAKLETQLGYTLDPEKVTTNYYVESGKLPGDGLFALSIDFDNITLDAADPVVGAYRLFDFNESDQFLHIDPFLAIHAVKLVRGSVTLRTLDADDYSVVTGRDGLRRFLQLTWPLWRTWIGRAWGLWGNQGMRLAVDADWLWPANDEGAQDIPDDLMYAWADYVTHLSDDSRYLKSEQRGTRSYTKADIPSPLDEQAVQRTIAHYAGSNGTAARLPV